MPLAGSRLQVLAHKLLFASTWPRDRGRLSPVPFGEKLLQLGNPLLLSFLEHRMINLGGTHEVQLEVEQAPTCRLLRNIDDLKGQLPGKWRSASSDTRLKTIGSLSPVRWTVPLSYFILLSGIIGQAAIRARRRGRKAIGREYCCCQGGLDGWYLPMSKPFSKTSDRYLRSRLKPAERGRPLLRHGSPPAQFSPTWRAHRASPLRLQHASIPLFRRKSGNFDC